MEKDCVTKPRIMHYLGLAIGTAGFTASLTLLFFAMRAVMELGGFVAKGGSYVIAHPAPDWVWIFPVSIWAGVIFVFIHHIYACQTGGLSLLPYAWPALFLSLGYNFFEFSFRPPGGGIAFTWLACGLLFVLMGGIPLLWVSRRYYSTQRRRKRSLRDTSQHYGEDTNHRGKSAPATVLVLAATVGGIYGAVLFFQHLSR